MKRISLFTLSALGALLCGISCSQEEPLAGTQPSGEQRPGGPVEVEVQLRSDAAQAARAGEGGAADAESTLAPDPIRTLRLYAYNSRGERVGYLHDPQVTTASGTEYRTTMTLTESGPTTFVAIGNEDYAEHDNDSKNTWTLEENTALEWFTQTGTACKSYYTGFAGSGKAAEELSPLSYTNPSPIDTRKQHYITLPMQHCFARLRVRFRKNEVEGGQPVTVKKVELKNRPRTLALFGEDKGDCYPLSPDSRPEQNDERQKVLFEGVKTVEATDAGGTYDEWIADNRIFPNLFGTAAGGGWQTPGGNGGTANNKYQDYGYYLLITYNTGSGEDKTSPKTWLPAVRANEVIDVSATIRPTSGELSISVSVAPWEQGAESDISYGDAMVGKMTFPEEYPQEQSAYAVAYDNGGYELLFKFLMETPLGARWNIGLSNGRDFRLEGTTSGYGLGTGAQSYATFKVVPTQHLDAEAPQTTDLYITLTNVNGDPLGKQVIPGAAANGVLSHPGTKTTVAIRQVSKSRWEELKNGSAAARTAADDNE